MKQRIAKLVEELGDLQWLMSQADGANDYESIGLDDSNFSSVEYKIDEALATLKSALIRMGGMP